MRLRSSGEKNSAVEFELQSPGPPLAPALCASCRELPFDTTFNFMARTCPSCEIWRNVEGMPEGDEGRIVWTSDDLSDTLGHNETC